MTMNHPMLQKKLQELESILSDVASLPVEEVAHRKNSISRDIELRIIFLKTLIAAEISSNPETPESLSLIADRLTELEDAFHRWKSFKDPLTEAEAEDCESFGVLNGESVSTCSCTESCLNMLGEAEQEEEECRGLVKDGVVHGGTELQVGGREKACLVRVLAFGFVGFLSFGLFGVLQHVEDDFGLIPT